MKLQDLFKMLLTKMSWCIIPILMIGLVTAQTNYNPVGSNYVNKTSNNNTYQPVTVNYTSYIIPTPNLAPTTYVNNSNYIIINITNNITNNVTTLVTNNFTNNITNNVTSYITNYVNFTNNITNNISIENNITNNISNNFYAGWLTFINNITNNVTNNITQYINTTNVVMVENNFTNNITNNNYVTNNVTTQITVNITTTDNETIINNVTVNLNVYNITNNLSNYFNFPISLSPYILTYVNSSDISFNETLLQTTINTSILNMCLLNNVNNYNLTVNNLNVTGQLNMKMPYGMFSDDTQQPATLSNRAYIMNFSQTDDNYLVNINANKQNFTVNVSGDYKITIDTMGISSSTSRHLYIWIQKNGVDVPRTTSVYEFKNINAETLISQSYIIDLKPTDTFRVMYGSDSTGVSLLYTINSAWYPSSPSARITIHKIGDDNP